MDHDGSGDMHFAPRTRVATGYPAGVAGGGSGRRQPCADPNVAHLAAVRLVGQDGFDRLVLEFADRVPGYTVGYRPLPAHADASVPVGCAARKSSIAVTRRSGWSSGDEGATVG